jgi:hypothetical protein
LKKNPRGRIGRTCSASRASAPRDSFATRKDTTNHRAEWKHGLVDRALMLAASPLMEGNSIGEELLNDAMNGNVADQLRTHW